MIEKFTVDTLHELENFARLCFREFNYPGEFDWKSFSGFWDSVLKHNMGEVWKVEQDGQIVGSIGLTVFSDPFNGKKQGVVGFWHMAKEARSSRDGIRLMKLAIAESKERGCYRVLHGHPTESKALELLGFKPIEIGHQLLF